MVVSTGGFQLFRYKFRILLLSLTLLFGVTAWAQNVTTLTPNPFDASGDLAVDAQGNIFVANLGARRNDPEATQVYKVTPAGQVSLFADGFLGTSGNTFDGNGNLYQASFYQHALYRISPGGVVTQIADSGDGLDGPTGLTFDSRGNLFVANCWGWKIVKITPGGASTDFSLTIPQCPKGLTSDDQDNLYVTFFHSGLIYRFTPQGAGSAFADTTAWSGPEGANGHIIFANERLYLASDNAHQVLELSMDGEVTVLAGTGERGYADGPLLEAVLSNPTGIDVSPNGRLLYINTARTPDSPLSDWAPNDVRVIDLPGFGQEDFQIDAGLNGNWWNGLERNGEGVQVEVSDGGDGSLTLVATIYSYDSMGNQIFLIAVGTVNGDAVEADVFITDGGLWGDDFDPDLVNESQWGTGTFTASSCEAMHMSLMPNAQFQGMGYTDLMYDLIRLTTPSAPCPIENPN
jgi:sugar lactone lactonase YvrE